MSDYIHKVAAMEIVRRTSGDYAAAFSEIRRLPGADVMPVVHGRWVNDDYCSECGAYIPSDSHHDCIDQSECFYCYSCGARMDGERRSDE